MSISGFSRPLFSRFSGNYTPIGGHKALPKFSCDYVPVEDHNSHKEVKHGFKYADKEKLRQLVSGLSCVDHGMRGDVCDMLFRDIGKVTQDLSNLKEERREVNGLFVKEIDVFSNGTCVPVLVKKLIPKTSKLPSVSRGLRGEGVYGFCGPRCLGRGTRREDRPLLNLLMLKFFLRVIEECGYSSGKFFCNPRIVADEKGKFFQVMDYVDDSVKIFNQVLPEKGETVAKLVLNLCEAACLCNVTFQCDCVPGNFSFVRDEFGDICDIRTFDSDIMDSGDARDGTMFLDFTNLAAFNAKGSNFQVRTGIGCLDARAALPPLISRGLYDALVRSLETLRLLAVKFASKDTPDEQVEVPFMLREGGLLEQWLSRVMIVGDDGRLYKNATSVQSVDFDELAALFVLHKLGCANRERALFIDLSFVNLECRYEGALPQGSPRERELEKFFRDFGF